MAAAAERGRARSQAARGRACPPEGRPSFGGKCLLLPLEGFNRVAALERNRHLDFQSLGWGDEEGAVFMEALRGAAVRRRALRLPFPRGAVGVFVEDGNRITKDEAAWKELDGKFEYCC